jgi:3'(2'), 5'-bisphosphate nucleotidase
MEHPIQSLSSNNGHAMDFTEARLCEPWEGSHSAHAITEKLRRALGIKAQPVRLDSQCKYGVVARGEADIYLRLPTRADYIEPIWASINVLLPY